MRAVNLIPSDQRRGGSVGAGRSGGAAYAVLALLVGFAVLAFMYGKATRAVSSDESKANQLSARASQAKSAAEALAPYTSFVALRQQREQAVTELVDTRFDWAHTFHELGRVLTRQVSVSQLSGEVGSQKAASSSATSTSGVSSATPAGSVPTFTVGGCATSQKAVAQMLQRLRLIDGVAEVTLQSSTKGGGSGASSSGGGCPAGSPVFAVAIAFEPLPSPSQAAAAASSQTKTVSDRSAPTGNGGEAR
jgi:Tfp pilus assembly protein PilN